MNSNIRAIALSFVLFMTTAFAFAQSEALRPMQVTPDQLKWTPNPGGSMNAVLVGDSAKAGLYASRTKFSSGYRVEPHSHPNEKIVMVLSGTVWVGYGEQFDESKMKAMPAGSVWTEPPNQPHFAWAKEGEVILHVVGNGPTGTNPVRPRQ